MAAVATILSSCSSSDGSGTADDAQMRTVTTPLGTYDIPYQPQAGLGRRTPEPTSSSPLPWNYRCSDTTSRPSPSGFPSTARPNTSATSPIWSRSSDSHPISSSASTPTTSYWPAAKLQAIAPVLTTESKQTWRENLTRLSDWLGRTPTMDRLITDYDALITDIRTRHASAIAGKTVASLSYSPDKATIYIDSLPVSEETGKKNRQPTDMTLADIGGRTLSTNRFRQSGTTEASKRWIVCKTATPFMVSVTDSSDTTFDQLSDNKLWQRLPAVQAGNVTVLQGSTYYGSIYTNMYVAKGWDDLYSTLD